MARDLEQRMVHAASGLTSNCSIGVTSSPRAYFSRSFDAISALISFAARITLRIPAAAPSTKNTIRKTGRV